MPATGGLQGGHPGEGQQGCARPRFARAAALADLAGRGGAAGRKRAASGRGGAPLHRSSGRMGGAGGAVAGAGRPSIVRAWGFKAVNQTGGARGRTGDEDGLNTENGAGAKRQGGPTDGGAPPRPSASREAGFASRGGGRATPRPRVNSHGLSENKQLGAQLGSLRRRGGRNGAAPAAARAAGELGRDRGGAGRGRGGRRAAAWGGGMTLGSARARSAAGGSGLKQGGRAAGAGAAGAASGAPHAPAAPHAP
jgi:hypothetical protein